MNYWFVVVKKGLGFISELLICCGEEGFRVYSWIFKFVVVKKGLGLIRELLICCGAEGFRVYSWIMDLVLWRRVFRVLFTSYWFCCWVKGVLEMKWGVLSIGFKDQIRGPFFLERACGVRAKSWTWDPNSWNSAVWGSLLLVTLTSWY
jgi:hypothetical protein